ncbi:MAG: hypothetical protein ACREJC_02460, partial [Tepidisphaeraceae bacterium]
MSQELDYCAPDAGERWARLLRRVMLTAALIAVVLLFVYLSPFVAMRWHSVLPRQLGNALFFAPQTALPYDALVW